MSSQMKIAIVLINLGTPDSPEVSDVRKYLREFLMDSRVMDMPFIKRWLLVNCIIAPFRAPKSAELYRHLWTSQGSPLKAHGFQLKEQLQKLLGKNYYVSLAMRYQNPSIRCALEELKPACPEEIIVIPLYPQYASASTGSTVEKFFEEIKSWEIIPQIRVLSHFFEHPLFLEVLVEIGRKYMDQCPYDHFLFSYHGLPESQIKKSAVDNYCQMNDRCCSVYHQKNSFCYRAQSFATSRLLAEKLGLRSNQYTVCFQSRLGKTPWIRPYSDHVVKDLAKKNIKKILCFSPSFVADCLETTIEIGVEYKKLFLDCGGERLDLVESLNTHPQWVQCLKTLILEKSASTVLTT